MTDFERKGEEALERARRLLAKAKGPDADFSELDDPDLPEELDEASEVEDEERHDDGDEDVKMQRYRDERGEDEEEEEEEPEEEEDFPDTDEDEKPVAKAVDALPILAAIEERLRRLEALERRVSRMERRNAALAKALGEMVTGVRTLAKGYASLLEAPRRPKAHTAVVPTGRKANPSEVFAKALAVVKDPVRAGILEHYANRGDLDGLLAQLTAEERAKVLGGE
ncbi:hypothetical protein KZX47_12685 [Thermus sp. SYSU G05001]|uniref:Uncharacterized protein n=1 Tax=Thermus brevis TaxID=2862456 RepID=A0ABS7A1P6_9DEIN|nr:hypothetical protein [Thermus brevis]MBW6396000.1 hypothetical protein [Thermus brevis]